MAGKVVRRGAAVTALALVSGSALALATATPAGAAKTHAPAYYQGVTSANVLGVALHLPSALPALPGLPKDRALNLTGVNGNAGHNTIGTGTRPAPTAVPTLANGPPMAQHPAALA